MTSLGLPVDPGPLIASYESLRQAARDWLRSPGRLDESDRGLAELALVTADRLFWEPYACMLGFSSRLGVAPASVLAGILQEGGLFAETDFFVYSEQFITIPAGDFWSGTYVLARHYEGSSFANAYIDPTCVDACLKYEDPNERTRCLRSCLA